MRTHTWWRMRADTLVSFVSKWGVGSTVVASPAGGARGPGFVSRWRQIISVRGSDGICKYLPYFSSYLMLIMRAFVVSVCIN